MTQCDRDIGETQPVVAPALAQMLRGRLDDLQKDGFDRYAAFAHLRDEGTSGLALALLAEFRELERMHEERPHPRRSVAQIH